MSDWLDIHAYADEQLSADERARVQERLTGCEESQRELRAIQTIKSVAAERRDSITCDKTWSRCQRRLAEMDKTHRVESFIGRYAWAVCSFFLVCIIGAGMLNRGRGGLGASEVPRMAANLAPFLSSPSSQDQGDQQRFIQRTAGGAPVNSHPQADVALIQGGAAIVDGHRVVRLDLRDGNGVVVLVAVEDAWVTGLEEVPGRPGFFYGQVNDMNCVSWQLGNYGLMLHGRRSVDELCAFAQAALIPQSR